MVECNEKRCQGVSQILPSDSREARIYCTRCNRYLSQRGGEWKFDAPRAKEKLNVC